MTTPRLRRHLHWAGACAVLLAQLAASPAQGQEFPARPINVIVPYAAGGGSDISVRVVQHRVAELLGKALVVDNRGGGGTLIGTRVVAAAPADGYTIGVMDPAFLINPALVQDARYDPMKDFTPVSLISVTPLILAIPESFAPRTLQELVAYAKANPGKLNYGSPGSGSAGHLAIEQFRNNFGLQMTHVPYKGSGPGTTALLAAEVHMMMAGSAFVPLVQSGRLRALAVSGSRRLPELPAVPTFAELGYPQINVQTFASVVAPAGTPRAVIGRLSAAFAGAVKTPEVRAALEQRGQLPVGGTPEELAAFFQENLASLLKVVRESNVKLD